MKDIEKKQPNIDDLLEDENQKNEQDIFNKYVINKQQKYNEFASITINNVPKEVLKIFKKGCVDKELKQREFFIWLINKFYCDE